MAKTTDRHYFLKICESDAIQAKSDSDAVRIAIKRGLIDPTKLENYAVVYKRDDGTACGGVISQQINWDEP